MSLISQFSLERPKPEVPDQVIETMKFEQGIFFVICGMATLINGQDTTSEETAIATEVPDFLNPNLLNNSNTGGCTGNCYFGCSEGCGCSNRFAYACHPLAPTTTQNTTGCGGTNCYFGCAEGCICPAGADWYSGLCVLKEN